MLLFRMHSKALTVASVDILATDRCRSRR